jgi:hypothetical protein
MKLTGAIPNLCRAIDSDDEQELAIREQHLKDHAIIFDEKFGPSTGPQEIPLGRRPLAAYIASPLESLTPMSRINFGAFHTVKHNMKIHHVGNIADSSIKNFNAYVAEALETN